MAGSLGRFQVMWLLYGSVFVLPSAIAGMFSSFTFQSVLTACLLCSHFLPVLMAKDRSHTKSRAAKWLEPYNKRPINCTTD